MLMVVRPVDASASECATELSVNEDLLRRARAPGIHLSRTLEERLAKLVVEQEQARWLEANREAIEDYDRRSRRVNDSRALSRVRSW